MSAACGKLSVWKPVLANIQISASQIHMPGIVETKLNILNFLWFILVCRLVLYFFLFILFFFSSVKYTRVNEVTIATLLQVKHPVSSDPQS